MTSDKEKLMLDIWYILQVNNIFQLQNNNMLVDLIPTWASE